MSKVARSIDITRDEDNYSDVDEGEMVIDQLAATQAHSAWEMGGVHRDHVIQNLLYLGGQLGFYSHVSVDGAQGQGQEKVFYRGIYAPDEVDAIRRLLIDQDDPVDRQLTVYVASIKMVPQFLVPLFYQAVDEKPFAMSLIRLFLLLTKPMARSVADASAHIIKKSKGKESASESKARIAKEQMARKNAYDQINAHISFKEALVSDELFVVLLKYLEEPLSKPSHKRSEDDKIVIESILTLINNLLRISNGPFSPDKDSLRVAILHNKLILALQGPFLDIILLLCQGVMERDNNPWRVILVEIVHFILSRREAKELYKIYAAETSGEGSKKNLSRQVTQVKPSGALAAARQREMESRMAVAGQRMGNRHSRFAGQFVVPGTLGRAPVAPPAGDTGSSPNPNQSLNQAVYGANIIVSNPFSKVFSRPSAPRRNEKKSAPFCIDDARTSGTRLGGHHLQMEEERKADLVITNFLVDFLDNAFSELVFSVKEGWRRGVDEADGMTGDEELGYYRMITTCLTFHRLKQLAEQKKCDLATQGNNEAVVDDDRWAPDLRSVTQCFDRMSFIRPVDFMSRLKKVDKKPEKIVFAVELYTELVCYLRLMVESIEPAHNDIALAALYKIFYIRQEKEDPLPSLLREWAPGTYGRRHLVGIVTLSHEIMKTLDAARIRFREEARLEGLSEDADDGKISAGIQKALKKKRKGNNAGADSERSVYLVAACKFEPEEYLKRVMATNQAVKIYTCVLELYKSNTSAVNYYVHTFMQRLFRFRIEDDGFGEVAQTSVEQISGVSLAHMFFNIKSLNAFNTLLQDTSAERDPNLSRLVRLVKQIVIQFGVLVERNKLAFVEALFTPAFPSHHSFLTVIDSVYDAKRAALSGGKKDDEQAYSRHSKNYGGGDRSGSDESDFGDEFDEHGDYAMRAAVKPTSAERKKNKKRTKSSAGSKWTWSAAEDRMLKEKYKLYKGTYSAFDMIVQDIEFKYASFLLVSCCCVRLSHLK